MTVIYRQITTRPTIQDLYWFEILDEDTNNPIIELINSDSIIKLIIPKFNVDLTTLGNIAIRPDLEYLIGSEGIELQFDPSLTFCEFSQSFDSLENLRQEYQKLFDTTKDMIYDSINKTNNTVSAKIYDENGIFIEYGVFNTVVE